MRRLHQDPKPRLAQTVMGRDIHVDHLEVEADAEIINIIAGHRAPQGMG